LIVTNHALIKTITPDNYSLPLIPIPPRIYRHPLMHDCDATSHFLSVWVGLFLFSIILIGSNNSPENIAK